MPYIIVIVNFIYGIYFNCKVSYKLAICYFQKQTWQAVGPRCAHTAEEHPPSEKMKMSFHTLKAGRRDVQLHSSSLLVNQRMDWLWTGWVWGTTHPRSVPFSLTFSFSHFNLFQTVHWRGCEHQQNSSAPTEEGPWLWQVTCRSVSFPILRISLAFCNSLTSCLCFSFTLIWV